MTRFSQYLRPTLALALVALTTACASTRQAENAAADSPGVTTCDSFMIYTMCMTDRAEDGDVDYVYFADDLQIFMFQPDAQLPGDMPIHRCARPIEGEVQGYGNALMYEDLNLLEEMDVKRKLLVAFMAAKDEVDVCYGGDSIEGISKPDADDEFASDDYDWGED
jgi:hypothetical protein